MARRKRATYHSKQAPASIKQRTRRFLIWTGVIISVLLLTCIGAYFFFMSWLQGEGFRNYLAGFLKQISGAQTVSVPQNLSVDGSRMTLPEVSLQQAPAFHELSVHKLHLEVNRGAILQRMLKLRHLSVEEMQLTLRSASAEAAEPAPQAQAADAPQAKGQQAPSKGFFKSLQAPSFESHYTDTTILTGEGGSRKFSLSGYHLLAVPKPEAGKNAWAIAIENGRILTPFSWLRESGLKSATLLYLGDEVQLNNCRVLLTPGDLTAKGVYHPLSGLWKAEVNVNQADVARILNSDWRKRLSGRLYGKLEMSGEHPKSWEAHGNIRLTKGVLEGFPILSDLKLNGTTPYRSISLEKATCSISYPYSEPGLGIRDAWLWDHIDIRAAKGELLIRGRVITGADGSLSGALSIGIPTKTLAELGLSQTPVLKQLFNAPVQVKGYAWVHVNLSGTIDSPQEDISVRLATILPQALPQLADQAVKALAPALGSFLPAGMVPPADDQEQKDDTADDDKQSTPRTKSPDKTTIKNAIKTGLDLLF